MLLILLNKNGINATLDQLGESTSTREEAIAAAEGVIELLDQIDTRGVSANVSVKLTQIGLSLDENLCAQNLERILARAKKYNNFVRIDMEDTPYTDQTLQLFKQMQKKGYTNSGIVVQSYLYRTEKDTRELLTNHARIRLVKGAYKEPADLAYPKKVDVDANFDVLITNHDRWCKSSRFTSRLVRDGRIPPIPAIGSHDPKRIEFAKAYARQVGLPNIGIGIPNVIWDPS